jgi:hypothetical protein
VAVEHAQLTHQWGAAWNLLAPEQQAFIPRSLFVNCMGRIQTTRPKAIRIVSLRSATFTVPSPTPRRVAGKLVRVHVDYGSRAPSQDVVVKAVPVAGGWRWVIASGSRQQFVRQNFCNR